MDVLLAGADEIEDVTLLLEDLLFEVPEAED